MRLLKIFVDKNKSRYIMELLRKRKVAFVEDNNALILEKVQPRAINVLSEILSEYAVYHYMCKALKPEVAYVLCLHGKIYMEMEYINVVKKELENFIRNENKELHIDSFVLFNLKAIKKEIDINKDFLKAVYADIGYSVAELIVQSPVLNNFTITIDCSDEKQFRLLDINGDVINEEYLRDELFISVTLKHANNDLAHALSLIMILTLELPIPINIKISENVNEKTREIIKEQIDSVQYYGFSYLNIV